MLQLQYWHVGLKVSTFDYDHHKVFHQYLFPLSIFVHLWPYNSLSDPKQCTPNLSIIHYSPPFVEAQTNKGFPEWWNCTARHRRGYLRLATGGWRAVARSRPSINTHAAHGGPRNYCTHPAPGTHRQIPVCAARTVKRSYGHDTH